MFEHNDPDITLWLSQTRLGDSDAFTRLFNLYFHHLRCYVRPKLTNQDRHEGYEEDLAVDTLEKLWEDLTDGLFAAVVDGDDLWFAIMCIANSQSVDRRRFQGREKRCTLNRIVFFSQCSVAFSIPSRAMEFKEEWEAFVKSLPDDHSREIVRLKKVGIDVTEIAIRLNSSPRTVTRHLKITRDCWAAFVARTNYF